MLVDLILKDIEDEYVQENFFRLRDFLGKQIIFDGDFKLFDITIPAKTALFKVSHGLTFIPADIILLSAQGNNNFFFVYQNFDRENIFITADGPVRIRFLAGKLKDNLGLSGASPFPFVAPGDVVRPGSPGFVFGAVDAKTTGFWMTSEQIPSNVVGVPILFGDAVVVQAAVGTEVETNYTIGIFQHEGAGLNLQQLGQFNIIAGGDKRVALNFPVIYSSPNVQLACRLLVGNTLNLKVSLVVKGSSI